MFSNILSVLPFMAFSLIVTFVTMTSANNQDRVDAIENKLLTSLETSDKMKDLQEKINEHSMRKISKMNEDEAEEFVKHYDKFIKFTSELGHAVGEEIRMGISNYVIWANFDMMIESKKSERYFKNVEDVLGKKDVKDLLAALKKTLQRFTFKLQQNNVVLDQ